VTEVALRYGDAHDSARKAEELGGVLLHKHFECLEVAGLGLPNGVQGSLP